MLPYILSFDVLSIYFGYLHTILGGHRTKGLTGIAVYCVFRLFYKIVKDRENRRQRVRHIEASKKKFDLLERKLNIIVNDIQLPAPNITFQSVSLNANNLSFEVNKILLDFQARAVAINITNNCVVELIQYNEIPLTVGVKAGITTEVKSILQNIPVSLAEVLHVQTLESTAGLSSYLSLKASEDAVVVQVLKLQRAIPFIRTNVPQTGYISFASSNPIFGVTKNPHNTMRSPGGTSSGEAALISTGGSVLGVGTDIAGGLRIPAHFCGVCGFKPTSGRISHKGVTFPVEGQNTVATCVGPMSDEVAGLVAFMKCMCVPLQHQLDPTVSLMPFNNEILENTQQLCVGFFIDDGHTRCVPSVRRAVLEAKKLLEHAGYRVIPFRPPDLLYMLSKLYLPVLLGDHFTTLIRYLAIDSLDSCVSRMYYLVQIPYAVRWLWSWWFNKKDPVNATLLAVKCPQSVSFWWRNAKEIQVWSDHFMSLMMKYKIDALLCPVLPFAAVKLGTEESYTGCLTYCALFNLLNFPAGTVPITRVTPDDINDLEIPERYPAETSLEKKIKWDQLGNEDPQSSSLGLPVGVQIASLPFHDELVLRILADLEKGQKRK